MALKVRKSNSWVEVGGGTSYTLPTFGTTNGASGLRLTGSDSSTDDVNFIGAGGIQITGNGAANTLTITATSAAGKTYTLEGVDSGSNAILRLGDGTTNDDVTITAGTGITIDPVAAGGFTIAANSSAGKTYTLEGVDSDTNAILRLSDGSTNDDVTITAGNGIALNPVAAGGFTITATGTASFSVPGSDKQVLFNDDTLLAAASNLEYDKTGNGALVKTGGYIRCINSGGTNYAEIDDDGGIELKRTADTAGPYIDFKSTGSDADARIQMDRTAGANFSSIKFYTFNGTNGFSSERLRIGKSGEIGIAGANYGTSGQVLTSGGDGATVSWATIGGGTAASIIITDEDSSSWRDIVYTDGAGSAETLRANDASGVANSLQVRGSDGALRVKGDITAYRSSDITLKDNISPIKNALAKVSSISGNTFTWNEKSTDDKQGNNDTGVIAQEITALELPGVTSTRNDGTQAVMYEKLVPLLIEAIKELKEEVDELKSRS